MEKRSRPPQGYHKNLATTSISCARLKCVRKREVLGLFEAEQIVAKKMREGKSVYRVEWHGSMAWISRQPEHVGAEGPSTNRVDRDPGVP